MTTTIAQTPFHGETPGGSPLRSAFQQRAVRAVVELGRRLGESLLQEAVSAPTDYGVLLKALESEATLALLNQEDPLAAAKLRGLRARQELLEKEGGLVGAQEVAEHLGLSRQAVHKRQRAGRLLALERGRHGHGYPIWQLVPGGTLPGLEEVLTALGDAGPWAKLSFFLRPHVALDGDSPLERLRCGDVKPALRAARLRGEHGAL